MKKPLIAISLSLGLLGLTACADGPYGGPGPGRGVYGPEPVAYDGYYDDFYGPFYDGYWADDGGFYYSDAPGHPYRRDTAGHFRRDAASGFHAVHGTGAGHRRG